MRKLVIIIPSHNRVNHLRQILNDIEMQEVSDISVHTIAVIDGSSDGSQKMVRTEFPNVCVIEGTGSWYYTKCINEGVRAGAGFYPDLILTLNDDIRIDRNYLKQLISGYDHIGSKSILGSLSLTIDEELITFGGIDDIQWWRMKWVNSIKPMTPIRNLALSGTRPSKVLPGRGMLIDAKLFNQLNGFDEQLPQYGSDDDFCLRATKAGHPVNISYDAIVHSHHTLTGAGNRVHRNSVSDIINAFRNKYSTLYLPKTVLMIRRHGNALLMPFTVSIVILASLLSTMKTR
jgi:GT2 family glycosyltransferase